jgi:hypothetical protein
MTAVVEGSGIAARKSAASCQHAPPLRTGMIMPVLRKRVLGMDREFMLPRLLYMIL